MSNQVGEQFTVEDQANTPGGSGRMATVTQLYGEAATPRNITPPGPVSYISAPPPVIVPYGWRMIQLPDGRWVLEHERAEWNVICRAVEGKRAGRTYEAIAEELHAEGAPVWNERTDREYPGETRWHPQRVRRLVARHAPDLQGTRQARKAGPRRSTRHRVDIDTDEGFERMLMAAAVEMGEAPAP